LGADLSLRFLRRSRRAMSPRQQHARAAMRPPVMAATGTAADADAPAIEAVQLPSTAASPVAQSTGGAAEGEGVDDPVPLMEGLGG
jgi:hypothetical protein